VSEPSLLLVVEEAHPARGGDVHGPAGPPFAVSLELPDGSQRAAAAALDVAHIRGPNGAFALVRLVGLTVDDVPTGTRVFRIASPS
jgi:hypothetical protein